MEDNYLSNVVNRNFSQSDRFLFTQRVKTAELSA